MRSSDGDGRSIRSDALYPALSGEWEVPVTRNAKITPVNEGVGGLPSGTMCGIRAAGLNFVIECECFFAAVRESAVGAQKPSQATLSSHSAFTGIRQLAAQYVPLSALAPQSTAELGRRAPASASLVPERVSTGGVAVHAPR
jgi:hypothetical protein